MSNDFAAFLSACRVRVDEALGRALELTGQHSPRLTEAMRYSLFNGGKRVRPVLAYAAAQAISGKPLSDGEESPIDNIASALEAVHAYSLVHDDLPAMDDDDLRRGQPTCHIAFDEATAILAGDALQALAFELLALTPDTEPDLALRLVTTLSRAAGGAGMVAGQAIDLAAVDSSLSLAELENMHAHKTGALIRASVLMGALGTGKADEAQLEALTVYADAVGLAFQVQDDILDVVADTETLGKRQGADEALNKPTYVSLLGLDAAKAKALELHHTALQALECFDGAADPLRALSAYIVERGH